MCLYKIYWMCNICDTKDYTIHIYVYMYIHICISIFLDRISLCSPDLPRTWNSPASAYRMLDYSCDLPCPAIHYIFSKLFYANTKIYKHVYFNTNYTKQYAQFSPFLSFNTVSWELFNLALHERLQFSFFLLLSFFFFFKRQGLDM
jgi:hypothetical protein